MLVEPETVLKGPEPFGFRVEYFFLKRSFGFAQDDGLF